MRNTKSKRYNYHKYSSIIAHIYYIGRVLCACGLIHGTWIWGRIERDDDGEIGMCHYGVSLVGPMDRVRAVWHVVDARQKHYHYMDDRRPMTANGEDVRWTENDNLKRNRNA